MVFPVDARGVPGDPTKGVLVDLSPGGAGILIEAAPGAGARVLILVSFARTQRLLFGLIRTATPWNSTLQRIGVELQPIPGAEGAPADVLDESMMDLVDRDPV